MEPCTDPTQNQAQGWLRRMLLPLVVMFRQGTDPSRMAESLAFGTFLGILPLPGLNSILCAVVAVRRGLNMGVIQAVNWIMLPAQIGLLGPLPDCALPAGTQGGASLEVQAGIAGHWRTVRGCERVFCRFTCGSERHILNVK
jgi:hypothetical protein